MNNVISEIHNRIHELQSREIAPELKKSLIELNKNNKNLEFLESKDTLFLITGQQVGLFLGPAFTFYKALTVVETAKEIEKITNKKVLPIFWLQNEDHDFNEINHTFIPNSDGGLEKVSDLDSSIKTPVSNMILKTNIEELKSKLKTSIFASKSEEFEIINQIYCENKSYTDAFKEFLSHIFLEDGLLFFNPRDKNVSALYKDIFKTALEKNTEISSALLAAEKTGANQVRIIKDSPLFFYLEKTSSGLEERFRLEDAGASWKFRSEEKSISKELLLSELDSKPFKFSTTALLRPILQDYLFPNIGYIGGNAELEYFKQVDAIRPFFSQKPCILLPRLNATIYEPATRRLAEKLELTEDELLNISDEKINLLQQKLNPEIQEANTFEAKIKETLKKTQEEIAEKFKKVDATLSGNLDRANEKVNSIYQAVFEKYKEKLKTNSSSLELRINKLKNSLFPNSQPQERVIGFVYFWLKYGFEFKNNIKTQFKPFSTNNLKVKL